MCVHVCLYVGVCVWTSGWFLAVLRNHTSPYFLRWGPTESEAHCLGWTARFRDPPLSTSPGLGKHVTTWLLHGPGGSNSGLYAWVAKHCTSRSHLFKPTDKWHFLLSALASLSAGITVMCHHIYLFSFGFSKHWLLPSWWVNCMAYC